LLTNVNWVVLGHNGGMTKGRCYETERTGVAIASYVCGQSLGSAVL
jgi:hypothetical protein